MKINFKKIAAYAFAASMLFVYHKNSSLESAKCFSPLPFFASAKAEGETEEEQGGFDFIKSNENVKDLIYDGTLLFYGGIAFIGISAVGIVCTFLPRRRKNKKKSKQRRK